MVTLPIGNQTVIGVQSTYGAQDSLGVASRIETQVQITGCSFQPLSSVETLGDIDQVTSHWKLFAPATVQLEAIDRIITPWDGLSYDVDGEPQVWTDFFGRVSHQEVVLRKAVG